MNKHTAKRKRHRANAMLKDMVADHERQSIRPHKCASGRRGQAFKKALSARRPPKTEQEVQPR